MPVRGIKIKIERYYMTIDLFNKKIELKYSLRSLMMYENIQGNSNLPTTITDTLTFLYCIVISSTKDYSITFDQFIDEIDNKPEVVNEMVEWLKDVNTVSQTIKKN